MKLQNMRVRRKDIVDFVINNLFWFGTAILVIIVAAMYPLFLKNAPIDLLKRTAAYVIMALGVGCVLLVSGADLSAGRIMGLVSLIATSLQQNFDSPNRYFPGIEPWPTFAVLVFVLVIGALIGAFNGFFVGKYKLQPYIVTLSTQVMLYGTMLIYLRLGTNKSGSIACLTDGYKGIITNTVRIGSWNIPNFVWIAIVVIVVMWFIWNKTTLGKNMYAVGSNPEAAKIHGVNVVRTIISAFMIAGILYALNGYVEGARVGGPGASAGANAELDAIAACIIGGVSLKGGTGNIGGIIVGVILLQLITVALMWMSVSANYVYIIKGAIILIAVTIDARKHYAKE